MPRVVVNDLYLLVLHYAVILSGKMLCHDFGNQRLDLANHNPFDAGMHDERPGRDARAAADDEDRFRLRMYEGRNMAEHPLQSHVLRLTGGLNFSADVKVPHAFVN